MPQKPRVTITVESPVSPEPVEVQAQPLCVIHRAILPGAETDHFVVEWGNIPAKEYPEVNALLGGLIFHHVPDFNTLASLLSQVGQRMCYDEQQRGNGKRLSESVDANGNHIPPTITKIEVRDGFDVTLMEMKRVTDEQIQAAKEGKLLTEEGEGQGASTEPSAEAGELGSSEPVATTVVPFLEHPTCKRHLRIDCPIDICRETVH